MTGKELNDHLRRHGYTQTELAKALGKTQQNIQYIFKAKSVKTEKLEMIAQALGKDMSFFLPDDSSEVKRLQEVLAVKEAEIRVLNERLDKLVTIIQKARL